jgi:hypothetical protein
MLSLSILFAMQAAAAPAVPVKRGMAELECIFENADGVRKVAGMHAFHILANGPQSPFAEASFKVMASNRDKCGQKYSWNSELLDVANGYMMSALATEHMSAMYAKKGVSFKSIDEVMKRYENGQQPGAEIQEAITTLAAGLRARGLDMPVAESEALVKTYMELVDFKYFAVSKFTSAEGAK